MIKYKLVEAENAEKMIEIANFPGLNAVLSVSEISEMIKILELAVKDVNTVNQIREKTI